MSIIVFHLPTKHEWNFNFNWQSKYLWIIPYNYDIRIKNTLFLVYKTINLSDIVLEIILFDEKSLWIR